MRNARRIPALALAALLAAAPLATCLVAVHAQAAMPMPADGDCGASRAGETPALCGPQMVASGAPSGIEVAPAAGLPVPAVDLDRTPAAAPFAVPPRDAGPPGQRPPAWLRHSAFLI